MPEIDLPRHDGWLEPICVYRVRRGDAGVVADLTVGDVVTLCTATHRWTVAQIDGDLVRLHSDIPPLTVHRAHLDLTGGARQLGLALEDGAL